jgi:hypothetical protein
MGDKTVSVRVRFEGGDAVKAGLKEVGQEGSRALQSLGNMSRQTGANLQNAGYQVSDFFVQIAGGTQPSRALAQQLPQLLQGFGLIGVAASVLVAALPSLFSLFGSGATDAETLQKELDGLKAATDAYSSAAEAALEPMDKLIAKYGDLADNVREARLQQAELARGDAMRALQSTLGAAGGFEVSSTAGLGALQAMREDFRAPSADMQKLAGLANEVQFEVSEIARQYGISREQAEALAGASGRVRESVQGSAAEQVAAMQALVDGLTSVYGSTEAADEATGGLVEKLIAAVVAAADVAAVDMASPIAAAAGAAGALAGNLSAALSAQQQFNRGNQTYSGRGGDPRQFMGNGPQPFRPSAEVIAASSASFSPARGGAGGGGGADQDVSRAVALTESLRSETEKYALALEEVNRLKQKGLITDDTYARQVDKLNDKLGETGDLGKKAASAIRGAFDGLFDDPQAALKDLSKQLAMMALYQGLAQGFPSIFGAGGAVPLGIPGFASGGMHRGGLRIVGENGPELEATGPSMIYPASALRGMGGGGGVSVVINNNSAAQASAKQSRGPNGQQVVEVTVAESISGGRQDKSLNGRFGVKPQRVVR